MLTGVGAVYTTTGVPPPWGVSEILKIFTPISAQSFTGSSLTIMEIWPFWVPGLLEELELLLQPHNSNGIVAIKHMSTRVALEFIEFSLRSLRQFARLPFRFFV